MNLVNADFYNCSDLQQQEEDHLLFLTTSKIRIDEKIIVRITKSTVKQQLGTYRPLVSQQPLSPSSRDNFLSQFSRTQMFFKIVVLIHFTIFTRKHSCWSIFLINNFFKKRLQHMCFPVNISKSLKTSLS